MNRQQTGRILMFLSVVGAVLLWLVIAAGLLCGMATSEGQLQLWLFFVFAGVWFAGGLGAAFQIGKRLRDS